MAKIMVSSEYFSIKDTLECGQVFRFIPHKKGFKVYSADKCAYCYNENDFAIIECNDEDEEYFYNYFDLARDYDIIYNTAKKENVKILTDAANLGKGIRILNQNVEETLFSFIISQNNNIPRIKGIIEKLSVFLGEKKIFLGEEYYAFPTAEKLSFMSEEFFKNVGLGYRAAYIKSVAEKIVNGFDVKGIKNLDTKELKLKLLSLHGVGPKVADCVLFFGYRKTDSFPVDTWIEKVYKQDFGGSLNNREKQAEWFVKKFKENSGYYQQYLFFYKRAMESKNKD